MSQPKPNLIHSKFSFLHEEYMSDYKLKFMSLILVFVESTGQIFVIYWAPWEWLGGESGFNSFEEDIKGMANIQHLFNQNVSQEMKVDFF